MPLKAVAAPAVAIPKHAVFWADYLTRMHTNCTPQMLAPFIGTDQAGAAKVHAELVARNMLTHSGRASGHLQASQPKPVRSTSAKHAKPKSGKQKGAQAMPEATTEIRSARPADIPALAAIWHAGWHKAHADHVPAELTDLRIVEDFERRLLDYLDQTLVAVRGDELLGFVITREDELYQMYVGESAQGSGVAKTLFKQGENVIRANGYASAFLDCLPENARACAFYTKMGWTEDGLRSAPLDTSNGVFHLDCLVFRKIFELEDAQ